MKPRSAKRLAQGSPDVEELESVPRRGRPRIDGPDRTTTDKRRTQIRLAQRAYRERKEATISELTGRVALLERTVNDMNKTFNKFHDIAKVSSALQPPLVDELRKAAERFTTLIGSAAIEAENVRGTGTYFDIPKHIEMPFIDPAVQLTDESLTNLFTADTSAWSHQAYEGFNAQVEADAPHPKENPQPGAMEDIEPGAAGLTENLYGPPPVPRDAANSHHAYQNLTDNADSQQYYLEVPQSSQYIQRDFPPEISKELASPSSYSYRETSFVRRLMRSSLEAAYMLMMNPKPEDMERLCTYAFCFINKPLMMKYFKSLMARTARDNLELWSVPLYHVGNAGLHYPRDGIDASSQPPADWANAAPIGPAPPRQGTTTLPESMAASEVVDYAGCDGEWFDSNDVEQYLRTKGLRLDGQSSLVEIVDVNEGSVNMAFQGQPQALPSPSATATDVQTPRSMNAFTAGETFVGANDHAFTDIFANMTDLTGLELGLQSMHNVPFQAIDVPFQLGQGLTLTPNLSNFKSKRVFDVDAFLNSIVQKSTCLGRTLCFRRAAVDTAFDVATREIVYTSD